MGFFKKKTGLPTDLPPDVAKQVMALKLEISDEMELYHDANKQADKCMSMQKARLESQPGLPHSDDLIVCSAQSASVAQTHLKNVHAKKNKLTQILNGVPDQELAQMETEIESEEKELATKKDRLAKLKELSGKVAAEG